MALLFFGLSCDDPVFRSNDVTRLTALREENFPFTFCVSLHLAIASVWVWLNKLSKIHNK